jgi:hypothetical protein
MTKRYDISSVPLSESHCLLRYIHKSLNNKLSSLWKYNISKYFDQYWLFPMLNEAIKITAIHSFVFHKRISITQFYLGLFVI